MLGGTADLVDGKMGWLGSLAQDYYPPLAPS